MIRLLTEEGVPIRIDCCRDAMRLLQRRDAIVVETRCIASLRRADPNRDKN
jgi:hypothetical protein